MAARKSFPVLIVDDDPISIKIIKKILNEVGHEVSEARNGLEALELFRRCFFPIVLSDWMMPNLDGIALCRTLRNMPNTGYIYFILLTGKDSKNDIVAGFEAGADDFVIKPIHPPELLARLKSGVRILDLEKSLKKANEEIRYLSITDSLTKCYNRSYLTGRLNQEISRAQRYNHPLSVILTDIDHFKKINDTYGHLAGDLVLKTFADSILSSIRHDVDWAIRYGGEEFLIILPETSVYGASCPAEKLRQIIDGLKINLSDRKIKITASFGVSGVDSIQYTDKFPPEILINQADKYLYQAKKEGRNRVVAGPSFFPPHRTRINL